MGILDNGGTPGCVACTCVQTSAFSVPATQPLRSPGESTTQAFFSEKLY